MTRWIRLGVAALLGAMVASCASQDGATARDAPGGPAAQPRPSTAAAAFPPVRYEGGTATLDAVVRQIGATAGGGIVTIQGIDVRAVPPMSYSNAPYEAVVTRLAEAVQCVWLREPAYYLIVPAGYETLLDTRIAAPLAPRFEALSAPMAFGFNTKLFNVCATLSQFAGGAIVIDNVLGEQRVGEMTLAGAPLRVGLEAALRSARVAPGAFMVESTDEYVFVYAAVNHARPQPLIGADALDERQSRWLERKADVTLPAPVADPQQVGYATAAMPLGSVLGALSTQLGLPVEAEASMRDLPVNPAVYRGVRVRTVLDLLVRQWPLPHFGYELRDGRVLLRTLP